MAENIVTNIRFESCLRRKSLIGFVDFVYQHKFTFTDVGVHERLDKNGVRLVYPQTSYPIDHTTQKEIDFIISEHVRKQHKQGASYDKKKVGKSD